MDNATVREGLERYEIGRKVRALRLRKKMALTELGRHTGFSAALLSKIESSRIFPPLGTLLRIAMVFGVGLEHFFSDARVRPVFERVRRGQRIRLPGGGTDERRPAYAFESLDFPANERRSSAYLAEFFPLEAARAAPHQHEGFETIYVLSGKLGLTVGPATHVLSAGDSVYFDSSVSHSYRRIGRAPCRALVVVVP